MIPNTRDLYTSWGETWHWAPLDSHDKGAEPNIVPITWHATRCNHIFCKITSWISINPINIYKLNWEDYPNSPFDRISGLEPPMWEVLTHIYQNNAFSHFLLGFLSIWTSQKTSLRQLATSPAYISLQAVAGYQSSFAQRRWEAWETQLGHTVIQDFNPGLKIQDVGSWIQSICKRSGFKIPPRTRNVDFLSTMNIYLYS